MKCVIKKKGIPQPVCAGGQVINHVSAEIYVCCQEKGSCFPAVDGMRVIAFSTLRIKEHFFFKLVSLGVQIQLVLWPFAPVCFPARETAL